MSAAEWKQLLHMLTSIGLRIVSQDRKAGLVTVQVPGVKR